MRGNDVNSSDLNMHAFDKVVDERRKRGMSLSVSDLSESSDFSSENDNFTSKKKKISESGAPDKNRARKPDNILENISVTFPIRKVLEITFFCYSRQS